MKKQIKLSAKSENICKNLTKKVKIFINAADFAKCSAAQSVRRNVLTGKPAIFQICP